MKEREERKMGMGGRKRSFIHYIYIYYISKRQRERASERGTREGLGSDSHQSAVVS